MLKIRRTANLFFFFGLMLTAASLTVSAQSTVFNIPSTDVVAAKTAYLEGDFLTHFGKSENGGFRSYGYRMVYGARRNLEIGANFFYTANGSSPEPKEFQPNVKWKFYNNERHGIAASAGAFVFVPLDRSAGTRSFSMLYSNLSKTIKRARGMRLTGGGYTLIGARREVGTKSGAIVGVEQPVARRLTFLADWYSGKNRFGYSAAGFGLAVTKRQFLYGGYNFGNAGRANNYFSVFYGVAF